MNDPLVSRLLPLSVAVLMGGMSARFGSPKAFLPYRDKSLAAHLLCEASTFSSNVFAVARDPSQVPPDARAFPVVTDLWEERGPLSGLHAGLSYLPNGVLFLRGVDMPFLKREVVEGLLRAWEVSGRPDVVAPKVGGRWEPLCGLWDKKVLRVLEPGRWGGFQHLLNEGDLRAREVGERELRSWDGDLACLKNFNTREEWMGGASTVKLRNSRR